MYMGEDITLREAVLTLKKLGYKKCSIWTGETFDKKNAKPLWEGTMYELMRNPWFYEGIKEIENPWNMQVIGCLSTGLFKRNLEIIVEDAKKSYAYRNMAFIMPMSSSEPFAASWFECSFCRNTLFEKQAMSKIPHTCPHCGASLENIVCDETAFQVLLKEGEIVNTDTKYT